MKPGGREKPEIWIDRIILVRRTQKTLSYLLFHEYSFDQFVNITYPRDNVLRKKSEEYLETGEYTLVVQNALGHFLSIFYFLCNVSFVKIS